jgi:translocation and assembly module TamB
MRILFHLALAVVAFVTGAATVFSATETGRSNLAGLISDILSSPDRTVDISGISGIWSGELRIDTIVIGDPDGPWLAVRGIAVDWSPTKLLSGAFDADRLSADRVEMARLPKPGKPSDEPTTFSLPVDIDIRALDFPTVALGEAVTGGRVASVAATGKVKATSSPVAVDTDLVVTRSDGVAGRLGATVRFLPADNTLDLDVTLSEPQGGLLAGLLRLPGSPAVDLVLTGEGPASNWHGQGTFSVDGQKITELTAAHRLTDAGSAIEAKGSGEFVRFVPDRFKPLLEGSASFDIAGTFNSAGRVVVDRAVIDTASIQATATGQIDPSSATDFQLALAAKNDGAPLSFGTDDSPIDITVKSATVRALGAGQSPGLDISASLAKVATNTVQLSGLDVALHSDAFDLTARSGPVAGQATAAVLTIDNPTVAPLVAGQIRTRFDGTLEPTVLTVTSGTLASDTVDGRFAGRVSLSDGTIALDLGATVQAMALPAVARPLVGPTLEVTTSLERDAEGYLSANSLVLRSERLNGGGKARLGSGQIDADISGTLADIAPLVPNAKGGVAFAATASGALAGPDVTARLSADTLTVADRTIEKLDLSASGKADMAAPVADVTLSATVAGQPLAGKATVRTEDGKRALRDLEVTLGSNRITGAVALDDRLVPEGDIAFDLPDIGPLAALALEKIEGAASGSVAFRQQDGVPQARVQATAGSVVRGDLAVRNASVEALVSDYLEAPGVAGKIKAQEVRSGATTVRDVDLSMARDGDWTTFSGGATVDAIPARASGRVKVADGTTTVELASADATVMGIPVKLARPSTIAIANGVTSLGNVAVGLGGGTATVSGTAGSRLDLDVALAAIPASLANRFASGLDAAGTVSGTVKVTGEPSRPNVRYSIDWAGLQTSQTRGAGFGAIALKSSGTFVDNRLSFDATIADGSGMTLRGGGTVSASAPVGLDIALDGTVPFSFLAQRLAAQGLSLSGNAAVSIKVGGTAAAPVITGTVGTSGARFIDSGTGIAVNGVAARVSIGSGRATIDSLTGSLSTGGTITGSGSVGIDAAQGFPADLSIRIDNGRYTDGEVVTTTLSGTLTVTGPLASAPKLGGTVDLGKTVITIPEKLPSSLADLNVKHKNAPAKVKKQAQALKPAAKATGGGGSGLDLDLTINAPQQIFIRGRGLDAELGGTLRLVGPAASPEATGQFTMRRGRLAVLGRRLTFTEGTLGFSGSLVPYLDLTAQSDASDATVTVTVTGPANDPKFDFASVPVLPQDEVLARLIFGRSMSSLSPLQIAQLADAAAQLAGVGGTSSLLSTLRDRIGVDDIDVRTNDEGDTAVAVGKYLNDRTYVTLEKGDKAGSGKATIDLNVGRGVKLRGEATDGGEAKGGIFFEREY